MGPLDQVGQTARPVESDDARSAPASSTAPSELSRPSPATRPSLSLPLRLPGPGLFIGLLVLGLYVIVLARQDLNRVLPGGVRGPVVLLLLMMGAVASPALRRAGWSLAGIRVWVAAHWVLLALGGIMVGAALLRFVGLGFGLPYLDHPDEPAIADRSLRILQTGDWNPHHYVYPNLYYYLEAGVFMIRFLMLVSSGVIERLDGIMRSDFYLWGRTLTALLGTLTVPVVFLTARRLYTNTTGLIAAAFLAANSLHILNSQFITTDIPATFFTALALLAIAYLLPPRIGMEPGMRVAPAAPMAYLAAGIAMGLAIGTKYNSALVVLPFLLAHVFSVADLPGDRWRRFFAGRFWLALGAMALTFLLTTPFLIFDLPNFLNEFASVISHYRYGHAGFEGDSNWRYYINAFLHSDFVPTVLALAGVALAFIRHRRADLVIVAFPLALYFMMSSYRVNFLRNLLPIFPGTSILAAVALVTGGYALLRIATAGRRYMRLSYMAPLALILVVLLGTVPAVADAAQRDYRQAQPDSRVRAVQWFDTHVPPGTKIWVENPVLLLTPGRYLTGNGDHVTDHPLDWYVANRYEYVVLTAAAYKPVFDSPESNQPLHDAYVQFFAQNQNKLAVEFTANKTTQPGPTIQIYRTGYTPPQQVSDVHPQHPIGGRFAEPGATGGAVQLIGADYPLTAPAGQRLPLTLYWATERPLHADYTVFIHVTNAAGARVAGRDTAPRSGTSHTSQWQAGQVVVDEADVDLPADMPPGSYTLNIGLYVQPAGAALAFDGGTACPVCAVLGPIPIQAPAH